MPLRVLLCAMRARAHRWPLLFLRRPGRGRCEAEQWLRLGEAGGDWLHRRWGPPPALEPGQHSWPWRRHATPPPGPPLLPRCPGPWGQHLQRATLGVGRAADHPGAQRSGVGVRVGEPRAGLRIGWLFFIFFLILLFGCSFPFYFLFSRFFPSTPTLFWALLSYYREWRKKKVDSTNTNKPPTTSTTMASASSSAQAAFGLGRRKKNPGLLDQIGKFFGGDKKRKGKVRKGGRGPNLSGPGGLLLCMLVIFADFTPRTTFFFSFLFFTLDCVTHSVRISRDMLLLCWFYCRWSKVWRYPVLTGPGTVTLPEGFAFFYIPCSRHDFVSFKVFLLHKWYWHL